MIKYRNLLAGDPKFIGSVITSSVILFSCQSNPTDLKNIALQIKSNQCRIGEISRYVNDSWTTSIEELANYLPDELPEQERKNILKLKNAELIRMFESYDSFDQKGHEIVDSMELLDTRWADSLRNLSLENQLLEMKLDSLFSTIEDQELSDRLNLEVEDIKSLDCHDQTVLKK